MTTNSSTFKEVLGAILIACTVAFLASSCTSDVDNNIFVEASFNNNSTILVGNQTITADQYNQTFNYTVASNAQDQEDIKVLNQVKSSIDNDFRSVLSTININIKGEQLNGNASTIYTVKNISINGAYADGEFNFNTNLMKVADNAQTTDFTLPVAESWSSRIINANDEFENASEFSFHMIPQNVENAQIVIEYEVESNGYVIYRGTQVENLNGKWNQNKTYNYNIVLVNGASKISYNPTVG